MTARALDTACCLELERAWPCVHPFAQLGLAVLDALAGGLSPSLIATACVLRITLFSASPAVAALQACHQLLSLFFFSSAKFLCRGI